MSANVKYVANRAALKQIATSDGVAGALLTAAQNGAKSASFLAGDKFTAKVYQRGHVFRARAAIMPVAQSVMTERKVRALKAARPRL